MGLIVELLAEQQLPTEGVLSQRLESARCQLTEALRRYRLSVSLERQLLAGLLDRLLLVQTLEPAGATVTAESRVPLQPEQRLALAERMSDQWLSHVRNVWERLHRDAALLRTRLGVELDDLREVKLALGDRHRGGQTVTELSFEGGTSLIYKPRSVDLEAFSAPLLALLSSAELPLRGLDLVAGDGYGWVRKEHPEPCANGVQLARFHERLGTLLAIAYALGGTDLHEDNLIAVGEHPVLIDLETLVSAPLPGAAAPEQLEYSVFDVGLLPAWLPNADGQPELSGGIGGGLLVDGTFVAGPLRNVARLGTQLVSALDHAGDVQRGFLLGYRRLLAVRQELLELCESIRSASYRCVLRPTRHYTLALALALHGSELRHTGLRERLSECLPPLAREDGSGRARAAELDSLEALDIPYFSGRLAQPTLFAQDDARDVLRLVDTPWAALQRRLAALSESDLAAQAQKVAAAFAAAGAHKAPVAAGTRRTGGVPGASDGTPLACARAIAAALEATRCRTVDGGATWLQPRHWPGHAVWQVGRTDVGLATGRTGLAVFFAALGYCTGQRQALTLAADCSSWLAPALASWRGDPRPLAAGGVGALVYGLTLCGQLQGCNELVAAARELALLVPEPTAEASATVWDGHAGTVLGLLAAAEAQQDARAKRELVERALAFAGWLSPHSSTAADGFGHGAAGIRFSSWRLRAALLRAGLEPTSALTEQQWLSKFEAAPPAVALRCPTGEHDARAGLCNGQLGRALVAALSDAAAPPPPALLDDSEAELDLYCCGNAGLIDLGMELGQRWPTLRQPAERRLTALRARSTAGASYRLRLSPELQRPGLFDGLAGIGYMWLRQHDPRLPCVLLWNTLRS